MGWSKWLDPNYGVPKKSGEVGGQSPYSGRKETIVGDIKNGHYPPPCPPTPGAQVEGDNRWWKFWSWS